MRKRFMERALSVMLALCMAFLCLPEGALNVEAETFYDLSVNSTRVSVSNASDILGNGNFRYDDSKKTLYIKGYNDFSYKSNAIDYYAGEIENFGIDGLTICTEDDCTIVGSIDCDENTTFTGNYPLVLDNVNKDGIKISNGNPGSIRTGGKLHGLQVKISIRNTDLTVAGRISGNEKLSLTYNSALEIINSNVKVGEGIEFFSEDVTLTDCYIKTGELPKNMRGWIYGNPVVIKMGTEPPFKEYGFSIGDVAVNTKNAEDILNDGVFSFDASTSTLTINGADIKNKSITNDSYKGLIIETVKDSQVSHLNMNADTILTGAAKLSFANSWSTINAVLTVKDTTLATVGLDGNKKGTLKIINSNVSAQLGVQYFSGGITTENTVLCNPDDAYIQNGIVFSKGGLAKEVEFKVGELYDLFIGDCQVNSHNCDDVFRDGSVKYSPSSKTLNINKDLDLSGCQNPTIRNTGIDGLQIYDQNGDKDDYIIKGGFDIQADTTFRNPFLAQFRLKVIPTDEQNAVTVRNGAKLTLNCNSFAADGAIAGSATGEQLNVKYCAVTAKSSDGVKSAVNSFSGGITLDECRIESPEGGAVSGAAILDKDQNPILDKLIIGRIRKYGLSINGVQVTDDNFDNIESLFTKSLDVASKIAKGEHFASFDCDTQTLTLKNVDIEKDSLVFSGTNLEVEGDVRFCSSIGAALDTLKITGSGTLTSTDKVNGYLSALLGASLEIRETTVNAEIKGVGASKLSIFDSNITAPKIGTFINGITIEECTFESPSKAVVGNDVYNSDGTTIAENIVIKKAHVHAQSLTPVEAVEVTCETDGNIAYYQCSCGRKFKDKSAKNELTDEEIVIPATGHDLELVEKVPATCDEDGNKQYYKCKNCGNLYWDELAASPVSDSSNLVFSKHGHYYINTTYKWSADHSKVTATCYCKYDSSHIITETVDTVFTDNENERVYTAEFTDTHFTKQTVTVDISPAKILLGDLDKDGTVDVKDAALLTRYVNGWAGITIDLDAADLDRDGEVTLRDAMILTRYANAWDGYDTYIKEVEA